MRSILFIALGGALGSLCRYWVSGLAHRIFGASFPFGTVAVNLLGCLFFGAIWGLFENRVQIAPETRLLVLTGFLGAFTTFSTYMFESAGLIRGGQYVLALVNMAGQTLAGLALVLTGLALGRLL